MLWTERLLTDGQGFNENASLRQAETYQGVIFCPCPVNKTEEKHLGYPKCLIYHGNKRESTVVMPVQ